MVLTLEQQAEFVEEAAEIFPPIAGGWERMAHTDIRRAAANKGILTGALQTAWKLRVEKNPKKRQERPGSLNPREVGNKKRAGR